MCVAALRSDSEASRRGSEGRNRVREVLGGQSTTTALSNTLLACQGLIQSWWANCVLIHAERGGRSTQI